MKQIVLVIIATILMVGVASDANAVSSFEIGMNGAKSMEVPNEASSKPEFDPLPFSIFDSYKYDKFSKIFYVEVEDTFIYVEFPGMEICMRLALVGTEENETLSPLLYFNFYKDENEVPIESLKFTFESSSPLITDKRFILTTAADEIEFITVGDTLHEMLDELYNGEYDRINLAITLANFVIFDNDRSLSSLNGNIQGLPFKGSELWNLMHSTDVFSYMDNATLNEMEAYTCAVVKENAFTDNMNIGSSSRPTELLFDHAAFNGFSGYSYDKYKGDFAIGSNDSLSYNEEITFTINMNIPGNVGKSMQLPTIKIEASCYRPEYTVQIKEWGMTFEIPKEELPEARYTFKKPSYTSYFIGPTMNEMFNRLTQYEKISILVQTYLRTITQSLALEPSL